MNASGSATAAELEGLYFDDNGTASSAADSASNITNLVVDPLSGGVDAVREVRKFWVNRAGSTVDGITYNIELIVLDSDGNPDWTAFLSSPGGMGYKLVYETAGGSDASENVVDGLIASAPDSLSACITLAKGQDGGSGDFYVQATGNYANNTDTVSQAHAGAYRMNPWNIFVRENSIRIWKWQMEYGFQSTTPQSAVKMITKDIDFGAPSVRKKIYKVYLTYKCSGAANIEAYFLTNNSDYSSTNRKTFQDGTYLTSNSLLTTSGDWVTAELKPTTSSDANNIYSFKFVIDSDSGSVPTDFAINDISLVYRAKSVK